MSTTSRPYRILLIDPVYGRDTPFWFVPLGLGYIAAMLHEQFAQACQVEILRQHDAVVSRLRSERYDLVASTNYVWNTQLSNKYLSLAKSCHPETVTVQGGPHIQIAEPEVAEAYFQANPAVDYYVHGEGEETTVALVERLMDANPPDAAEPGLAFYRDGCYVDGGRRQRIRDLDTIPSPYLGGWLDSFLADGYGPIIETNRGCPFSCAFCNWGSATVSKVNRFSLDRVNADLEYIAERVQDNDALLVADANFGILRRDLEIAEMIQSLWKRHHYPAHIFLWHTKNASHRTIEIGKILGKKVRFLMAVQSLNPEVLKNIKRSNIKLEAYEEIATHARESDLLTASDLIIGLPGEDLASIKRSLDILYRRGIDKVDLFTLILIPGTDLYSRSVRERFGLKTMHRLANGCVLDIDGETVAETEEVVVETDTLSFDDCLTLGKYSALSIFWHHCGIGEPASSYARERGIIEPNLLFEMIESTGNRPDTVAALDYVGQQLRDELYPTHLDVQRAASERDRTSQGEIRAVWKFVHYVISEGLAPSLIDDMFDALERLLGCQESAHDPAILAREVGSLRAFTKAYQETADANRSTTVSVQHDIGEWMQKNYSEDLARFRLDDSSALTLRRDQTRLPSADLGSFDASTSTPQQFNQWFFIIRNVRNYVAVANLDEARA